MHSVLSLTKSVVLAWGTEVPEPTDHCFPGIFRGTSGQITPPLVNPPEEEAYLFTNAFILISKDNTDFLANPGRPRVNEVRQPWLFIPGHLNTPLVSRAREPERPKLLGGKKQAASP